jgi:hypothetical protein
MLVDAFGQFLASIFRKTALMEVGEAVTLFG